jgi:hypothetical protein
MNDEVKMISIEQIRIVNHRHRDPKKFAAIVQNIKNVGLKMPIQVGGQQPRKRRQDTI